MNSPTRQERRTILDKEVPPHLKNLVEYTVTDYYAKRKLKKTR